MCKQTGLYPMACFSVNSFLGLAWQYLEISSHSEIIAPEKQGISLRQVITSQIFQLTITLRDVFLFTGRCGLLFFVVAAQILASQSPQNWQRQKSASVPTG